MTIVKAGLQTNRKKAGQAKPGKVKQAKGESRKYSGLDVSQELYDSLPLRFPMPFYDRLMAALSDTGKMTIHYEMKFSEAIDERRLKRAYLLTLYAQPILMCRYVEVWWRPYFEKTRVDLKQACIFLDSREHYRAFKESNIETNQGPLLKCALWRQNNKDTLLLKMAHLAGDGAAMSQVVQTLANIYGRLEAEPEFTPPSSASGPRGLMQVVLALPLRTLLSIPWRRRREYGNLKKLRPVVGLPFPSTPLTRETSKRQSFVVKRLQKNQVEVLKEYAAKRCTSLNALFHTAFIRALSIVSDSKRPGTALTEMTINLRRYLSTQPASICNLSTADYLNIPPESCAAENFDDTLAQVNRLIERRKANWIGIDRSLPLVSVLSLLPQGLIKNAVKNYARKHILKGNSTPMLSNVGPIREKCATFGSQALEAIILPPALYPPLAIVGISGYKGQISFAMADFGGGTADSFLTQVISELPWR